LQLQAFLIVSLPELIHLRLDLNLLFPVEHLVYIIVVTHREFSSSTLRLDAWLSLIVRNVVSRPGCAIKSHCFSFRLTFTTFHRQWLPPTRLHRHQILATRSLTPLVRQRNHALALLLQQRLIELVRPSLQLAQLHHLLLCKIALVELRVQLLLELLLRQDEHASLL